MMLSGCIQRDKSSDGRGKASHQIVLKGTLDNGAKSQVWIEEMAAREFIPIDTVNCDSEGHFALSFPAEGPAFYVLHYGTDQRATLLMEPGEEPVFTGTLGEGNSYRIQGSPGSLLLNELSEEHLRTLKALGEVARRNMELSSDPNFSLLKPGLDRKFDSITASFRDYSLRFIKENSESLSILIALYNLYGQGLPVFHPSEDLGVYQYVDSVLYIRFPDVEAVELLHAQIAEAEIGMERDEHMAGLQKGKIAPDFVSSRPDGSELALSDLRGNYVLISFWAAWSKVSREENRVLKEAYETFRQYPFTILQVSLDDDREEWIRVIREEGLAWEQVSDLQRWDSPVANLYRVEKIPSNVLVDPEGRVVDTDILGDALKTTLESIFTP
ncbi:MAG: thioredoxin-like domain-containing protein [Bacteroidales bacterium]